VEFSEAGDPASPRLRRVLLAFILVASYEVLGEGEEMPVESLIFRLSMRYWLSRQVADLPFLKKEQVGKSGHAHRKV